MASKPELAERGEYFRGQYVERELGSYLHGKLSGRLGALFLECGLSHKLFPASSVTLEIEAGQIYRIPDLAVFAEIEPEDYPVRVAPLVVVEILSAQESMSELLRKFEEYREFGVRHVWMVDGEGKQLYFYDEDGLHRTRRLELREFGFQVGLADLGL